MTEPANRPMQETAFQRRFATLCAADAASIREIARLRRLHGRGNWRKRKGIARVRLEDGAVLPAEVHWYEAHGIGRRDFKIKRYIG